ncbi:MAG TPA: cob(I)yrinic acid a,c-diamide adenosyltransferase [Candidatus Omnitrophota bacterium]|nr:cob(I)yrinic acid a,c-diamide adenosyltransferase [Candidatus Omnitrophota bacterium]
MIYVFYGNGGGKTIAALGLALRARGHSRRVVIVQFMKNFKEAGEYRIAKKIGYQIYQFGRKEFVDIDHPDPKDYELALKGLEKARSVLKTSPQLLVLDEINLACAVGLVKEKDVIALLKKAPKGTDIVLTGRMAPDSFIKLADGVSEIVKIKHAYDRGIKAKRGIEY